MDFLKAAFWIVLGVVVLSSESTSEHPVVSDDVENDSREGKYLSETWHAVHTIPEGASGWVPRDPPKYSGSVPVKRRRLVKKKRRPPITTYLDQTAEATQYPDGVKSTWDALMEDQNLKPYPSRKRVIPTDQEQVSSNYNPVGATIHFGSEEFKDRLDVVELPPSTTTKRPSLKEILKQNGGQSLSEILQRKNITLSELLMGKQEAIQALTESSKIPTSTQPPQTTMYKRIPPSTALKKNTDHRKPEDTITSKEVVEAQKKRLALLQSRVKRPEVIIETTTNKVEDEVITEPYKSTSAEPPPLKPSKGLPITSAKIMKMITRKPTTTTTETIMVEEEENYPKPVLKTLKIDPKQVIGYPVTKTDHKNSNEPLHITIDLENIVTTTTTTTESITTETATLPSKPSAKDEILLILQDPPNRIRLSQILEARNMTIQELIEQRERGSSQLHLADIFHNNTKEPEPSEEPLEGKISSEEFPNFPVFSRQPKELQLTEETSHKPVEVSKTVELPRFKIPATLSEEVAQAENFPWQKLYPELFNAQHNNDTLTEDPVKQPVDSFSDEDVKIVEEIDQTLYASASNEEVPVVDKTPRKIINISAGVKSAIYASLAIILLSIVVFVTILVVFRWLQKKKMKNNYKQNLKPLQIKCENLKNIVSDTLQRKKSNYYKRHLQGMSDDSWERASRRTNAF